MPSTTTTKPITKIIKRKSEHRHKWCHNISPPRRSASSSSSVKPTPKNPNCDHSYVFQHHSRLPPPLPPHSEKQANRPIFCIFPITSMASSWWWRWFGRFWVEVEFLEMCTLKKKKKGENQCRFGIIEGYKDIGHNFFLFQKQSNFWVSTWNHLVSF